ncbi:MAG: hypothetical protein R2716_12765 [Microthrixaceae bacterium]
MPASAREVAEFLGLVVVLSALTTGPVYVVAVRVFSAPGTWEDGWIKFTFVGVAVAGSAVWASMAARGALRRPGLGFVLASAFTLLAVASTYWSILRWFTFWRSLTYVGLLATAWAVASLGYRMLVSLLVALGGLGTALSLVAIALLPDVGLDGTRIWRGIYTSPNSLGPVCAIAVLGLAATALEVRSTRAHRGARRSRGRLCAPRRLGVLHGDHRPRGERRRGLRRLRHVRG